MNSEILQLIDKLSPDITNMFYEIRQLIFDSVQPDIEEKLWAKLPSFYAGDKFVRIIPFKDHLNIEASAILNHQPELSGYKLTPKGMLQIYIGQPIPADVLNKAFKESLA